MDSVTPRGLFKARSHRKVHFYIPDNSAVEQAFGISPSFGFCPERLLTKCVHTQQEHKVDVMKHERCSPHRKCFFRSLVAICREVGELAEAN